MFDTELREGLTYDDVLLEPRKSEVESRGEVDLSTNFTKGVSLRIPLVSANMDTVTEHSMAIALARLGGIGIIHRFMSIEREAEEVRKVKRSEAFVIEQPYTIHSGATVAEAKEFMNEKDVSGLLVVDSHKKLLGIVSLRDVRFADDEQSKVTEVMTSREKMVVAPPSVSLENARTMIRDRRIEKLPLVDDSNTVCGLITARDVDRLSKPSGAVKDAKGRLLVGAAVGVRGDFLERARELVKAEVDALVLDVAHGHSMAVINSIRLLKHEHPDTPLVAGNVATALGTRDLISAGADAVKVGIGPGAACTTRSVTGAGVPQLTAVLECSLEASSYGIPVIADGGVKNPGDVTKALAAGASSVMMGSVFAGTDESPGYFITRDGIKYKAYRGMASLGANVSRRQLDRMDIDPEEISQIVPEGVEARVPYSGRLEEVVRQYIGGLRSGMSYCGAKSLAELRKNAVFIRLTPAGVSESYQKLGARS